MKTLALCVYVHAYTDMILPFVGFEARHPYLFLEVPVQSLGVIPLIIEPSCL